VSILSFRLSESGVSMKCIESTRGEEREGEGCSGMKMGDGGEDDDEKQDGR